MATTSSVRRVAEGELIFAEGDAGDCAYVIDDGSVAIVAEREGRRVQLASRRQGELIGEMAVVDGGRRSASAVALEDCRLIVITAAQLRTRIAGLDPVLRTVLGTILDRFRSTMLADRTTEPPAATVEADPGIQSLRLEGALAAAIREGGLELHLQPIVRLADNSIAGFESLVRWRGVNQRLIDPGAFIPVAEDSGLIVELTRWVVAEVCRIASRLATPSDAGPLFFTINLSGRDLADPTLLARLEQEIDRHGVDPGALKLEITESALMAQPDLAAGVLGRCRDLGLEIAIDDFGTGYSSFDYLHRFPVDCLKIDRTFMIALDVDPRGRAIVGSMINLAASLAIPVVAEGVESLQQARLLEALGCTFGQGFQFARPMPVMEAEALLARWPERRGTISRRDRRQTVASRAQIYSTIS